MENLDSKFAQGVLHSAAPAAAYVPKSTEGIVSLWRSKDGFFAVAGALVAVCTLLFAIQVVFGWWRRCLSNLFIKYSLWLAYTVAPTVATYTVGFTGSFIASGHTLKELSGEDARTLFLWSLLLAFLLLGSTNSTMAYDVDDNKQYMRHLVHHASYVVNMVGVIMLVMEVKGAETWGLVASLVLINLLYYPQRIITVCAGMRASSFSDRGSLNLQDYMKHEHLKSTTYNPLTLQGYNYPIFKKDGTDFTVSEVWQTSQGVLGSSAGARLKEVCLSFALCGLLRRRFFGAACPEAKLQKTHDLVFRGLLSNAEENYEYAYRVIETELAFAHDHFFTNSQSQCLGVFIVPYGIWKLVIYSELLTAPQNVVAHIVTVVIIVVLVALELLQLYIYLSSDILRVYMAYLCSIMPLRGSVSRLCRIQNNLPQLFGYWLNQIGQHSLLKDLHRRSIAADVMGSLFWIISFINPPAFLRGISNPGVKDPDRIPITCRVKKAIAQTLKSSNGHLSNGASSLERNGQVQLSKEFLLGSHVLASLIKIRRILRKQKLGLVALLGLGGQAFVFPAQSAAGP